MTQVAAPLATVSLHTERLVRYRTAFSKHHGSIIKVALNAIVNFAVAMLLHAEAVWLTTTILFHLTDRPLLSSKGRQALVAYIEGWNAFLQQTPRLFPKNPLSPIAEQDEGQTPGSSSEPGSSSSSSFRGSLSSPVLVSDPSSPVTTPGGESIRILKSPSTSSDNSALRLFDFKSPGNSPPFRPPAENPQNYLRPPNDFQLYDDDDDDSACGSSPVLVSQNPHSSLGSSPVMVGENPNLELTPSPGNSMKSSPSKNTKSDSGSDGSYVMVRQLRNTLNGSSPKKTFPSQVPVSTAKKITANTDGAANISWEIVEETSSGLIELYQCRIGNEKMLKSKTLRIGTLKAIVSSSILNILNVESYLKENEEKRSAKELAVNIMTSLTKEIDRETKDSFSLMIIRERFL